MTSVCQAMIAWPVFTCARFSLKIPFFASFSVFFLFGRLGVALPLSFSLSFAFYLCSSRIEVKHSPPPLLYLSQAHLGLSLSFTFYLSKGVRVYVCFQWPLYVFICLFMSMTH